MGRRPWSTRFTVEQCHKLTISSLCAGGLFLLPLHSTFTVTWNNSPSPERVELTAQLMQRTHSEWVLIVTQTVTHPLAEATVSRYSIPITRLPCNYGGWRYLFLCPQVLDGRLICRRRVTKLYRPPGQSRFGCRDYFNLTYSSTQQHDKRVDYLAKDLILLQFALRSGNVKLELLGARAYCKVLERLNRSAGSVRRMRSREAKGHD